MKKILIGVIAFSMPLLASCGKVASLMQPQVVEKVVYKERIVSVPTPFSWKNEFTGNRLIAKGVVGAVFAGAIWFAYSKGSSRGYTYGYDNGGHDYGRLA